MRKFSADFEYDESSLMRRVGDMIRREFVSAARALEWTLRGPSDENGEAGAYEAEVMHGLGYASLPAEDETVEAIAVNVEGDPDHSVMVAARAVDSLKAVIEHVGLKAGDRLLYTRTNMVKLVNKGIIYLGDIGVDFSPVALASHTHDLPALQAGPYVVTESANGPSPAQTGPSNANSKNVQVN